MRLGILKLKGLGGFVGEVTLDFSIYGCLLLDGKNGCGKSSILDSISWVLYDKSLRGVDKGDWINDQCKEGSASLTLIEGDDTYLIKRSRNKTTCLLEIFKNGESITAKNVAETQERIEKNILYMSFSVFKNSVMFGQEDLLGICYGSDADRKQIIGDILGFDEIDVCCKAVREDKTKQEVELVTKQTLHQDKVANMLLYEGINDEVVSEKKSNLSVTQTGILKTEESIAIIDATISSLQQIDRLKTVNQEIRDNSLKLETFETEMTRCSDLGCANNNELTSKQSELQVKKGQESTLKAELVVLIKEVEKVAKQIVNLSSLDKKQCPTCLQEIDADHIEEILSSYGRDIDECEVNQKEKVLALDVVCEEVSILERKIKALEVTIASYNKNKNEYTITEGKIETLRGERARISEELLQKNVGVGEDKAVLEDRKSNLIMAKKALESSRDSLVKEIGVAEEMIKQKIVLGTETIELVQSINGINATIKHLSFLENLLSLRGVKNRILESVIPLMEDETNGYLSVLLPSVSVDIDTTKQGKTVVKQELTFNLTDMSTNTERDFKLWSGGQKKLISLALRLALWKIVYQFSQRKVEVLFLDEVFGSLDELNREITLDFLKNKQIELGIPLICVDHIDDIKENFKQRIELDRNERGCFISLTEGV